MTSCNKKHAHGGENVYLPIEDYGMIGNLRTSALVGMNGSIDFMCWPDFDSPSIFCRLLDKDKGGFFSISPPSSIHCTTKQQYLPSSCILQTRFISDASVVSVCDFFPRPRTATVVAKGNRQGAYRETTKIQEELKRWLVRRVECIRGELELEVQIFPAFDYAREEHVTTLLQTGQSDGSRSKVATFHGKDVKLQLDVTVDRGDVEGGSAPTIAFRKEKKEGMLGEGIFACIKVHEGQAVSFVLRDDKLQHVTENITTEVLDSQQYDTQTFWYNWISKSKYKGRWREYVERSLMLLKMMTYEPTGAIVAAATFGLPEEVGGERNWDYRYCWVRDSSFTIYILLRMGYSEEADAYMGFISERFLKSRGPDGALPIMFTIRGDTDIPEIELSHLSGYRNSRPVRIGNGAAFHQQLDIYGELVDAIYLFNKYGKPIGWDTWIILRQLLDFVLTVVDDTDMSIWEVRGRKLSFVYSRILLWVALDRGIRLSDKRNLPCPNRAKWLAARDKLMEDVMEKGYNQELKSFGQSYEDNTVLDASILIAPLVFFIAPNDPRFTNTLDRILLPFEQGGLTSAGLVHRYDTSIAEDGLTGHEGSFTICTLWACEALGRAGQYEPRYLVRAVNLFENVLSFSNHLQMFSEEIARSGEQLGNTPQAFSHLSLISAAFNLDRVMNKSK